MGTRIGCIDVRDARYRGKDVNITGSMRCGKDHTVAEARAGNCLGVRAEMMRLRSLNY